MAKKSAPSFPSSQRFVLDGEKLMEELSACQFFSLDTEMENGRQRYSTSKFPS